jgi:hypothetical protein
MPPLLICEACKGGGTVHPTPYATAKCGDCDGKGFVDGDGTCKDPEIRDAPTLVDCPACMHCHGCNGKHLVSRERAAWINAAIKAQGGPQK